MCRLSQSYLRMHRFCQNVTPAWQWWRLSVSELLIHSLCVAVCVCLRVCVSAFSNAYLQILLATA